MSPAFDVVQVAKIGSVDVERKKSVKMLNADFLYSHLTSLFADRLTPRKECECSEECCCDNVLRNRDVKPRRLFRVV